MFFLYILDAWLRDVTTNFTLDHVLFEAMNLTEKADLDKYGYSGYGIHLMHAHNFVTKP